MIRNSSKTPTLPIIPGISLDFNPFAMEANSARRMENWIMDNKRLVRIPPPPIWWDTNGGGSTYGDDVRRITNFRYVRNSASNNKLLFWNTTEGLIWKCGTVQPFFPGTTSFSLLRTKPYVGQAGNRLFFSDGTSSYVYDGRDPVQTWGMSRSTTAPTVSAVAAGSLTAATGLKACITWVVLDEQSNRVHESSRSNVSSFQVLAAENLRVDIGALSAPARATHWSAYVSELDGSNIYRRAATTAIGTTTVDVSALPASTTPKAPVRNDPPPPSTVGCVAKNRHFLRDDANPNRFYFSALGEVEGLLNGSGPESFPGYGTNSISDLVNSDTVEGREIRAMIEHDNIIYIFTESKGYALVGELNLLDSRSPRSIVKLQRFKEGCMGPDAVCSTPYGLVWMSPTKKIWLWNGGEELIDIGQPIQQILNDIVVPNFLDSTLAVYDLFSAVHMTWWSGANRQWLVVSLPINTSNIYYGKSAQFILDFSIISKSTGVGSWFIDSSTTSSTIPLCAGVFQSDDGHSFLLAGTDTGVKQMDAFAAPAHLNQSCILGKTYLGSSVMTMPDSYLYSGLISPNGDQWCNGNYVSLVHGDHKSATAGSTTAPTTRMLVDVEDVDNLGNTPGYGITLDSILTSGEKRAWLVPQSSGNTNVGGAFGKNFAFFLYYTSVTDSDTTTDASGRALPIYNAIYRMALSWSPCKDLTR